MLQLFLLFLGPCFVGYCCSALPGDPFIHFALLFMPILMFNLIKLRTTMLTEGILYLPVRIVYALYFMLSGGILPCKMPQTVLAQEVFVPVFNLFLFEEMGPLLI